MKILADSKDDQIVLLLDMHNISDDQEFNPIHEDFAQPKNNFSSYIFLNQAPRTPRPGCPSVSTAASCNGRCSRMARSGPRIKASFFVRASTCWSGSCPRKRTARSIRWFLQHPQEMIWHVQVRRGLMSAASGLKSATAVIGVRFNSGAVDKM